MHLSGDACFVVLISVKEIKLRTTSAVQQLILSTKVLINCLELFNLLNADGLVLPNGCLVNMALNPYKVESLQPVKFYLTITKSSQHTLIKMCF